MSKPSRPPPPPPQQPDSVNASPETLSLNARLSRTPFTFLGVALSFCLASLASQLHSIHRASKNAEIALISACNATEQLANNAVGLPRSLALVASTHVSSAVDRAVETYLGLLTGALDLVLGILWLFVSRYTKLLVCSADLVIQATLGALKEFAVQITEWIDARASEIADELVNSLDKLGDWLATVETEVKQGFEGFVNSLLGIGGVFGAPPVRVDFTSAQGVLKFPKVWDGILRLKAGLPQGTVGQIRAAQIPSLESLDEEFKALVSRPFEMLKAKINESLGGFKLQMPVLREAEEVRYCSWMDVSWIGEIESWLSWIVWTCILVIIGTWIGSMLWDSSLIVLRYSMNQRIRTFKVYLEDVMSRRLGKPSTKLAWFLAYIFHPPSLLLLTAGVAGLILCGIELSLLSNLSDLARRQTLLQLNRTASDLRATLSSSIKNQLEIHETTLNNATVTFETQFNNAALGWANDALGAVNSSFSSFSETVSRAIEEALAPVPWFQGPLQNFVNCFIGSQMAVLNALGEILRKRLAIRVPRVDLGAWAEDPLFIGQAERGVQRLLVGAEDGGGLIGGIAEALEDSVRSHMAFFGVLVGVGIAVPLLGLLWLLVEWTWEQWQQQRRQSPEHASPLPSKAFSLPILTGSAEVLDMKERSPYPTSNYVLRRTSVQDSKTLGRRMSVPVGKK